MARVKGGVTSLRRRRKILSEVKGYRFGRSTKERQAREAIAHAGMHAFDHRRDKKGVFRGLWNIRINAAVRPFKFSYSTFIHALKKKDIGLNRKMLSEIAQNHPESFERIIKKVS